MQRASSLKKMNQLRNGQLKSLEYIQAYKPHPFLVLLYFFSPFTLRSARRHPLSLARFHPLTRSFAHSVTPCPSPSPPCLVLVLLLFVYSPSCSSIAVDRLPSKSIRAVSVTISQKWYGLISILDSVSVCAQPTQSIFAAECPTFVFNPADLFRKG